MRHRKAHNKLGHGSEHRKAILRNLATSLILHGRIRTTDTKAKQLRPYVERMVTLAKRGDLHARRLVASKLFDKRAVQKLFSEYGKVFAKRNGGYTRILKDHFRPGDNAPVSIIEFLREDLEAGPSDEATQKVEEFGEE